MLAIIDREKPETILEVGIWEGGTLWHWLQTANVVTAIDDTMRWPGADTWMGWANDADTDLMLIHGSSRNESVIDAAKARGPHHFVFIDADHSYDSVASDWANYGEAPIVAFHDITPRPDYGVNQLWQEIKQHNRTVEIVDGNGMFNGIGVVYR